MASDIKAARLFNTVCNVSAEDVMSFSGISEHRLKTMVNLHYIEEKVDKHGNTFYRTTIEGREEFEEKTGIRGYASNSYVHDKALYNVYVDLSEEEQYSWMTEREQRQYAEDHGYKIQDTSVCDGAYRDSETGEMVYVEIITSDYTDRMISAKVAYVEAMNGVYEPHEI